jgi:hypothetical protein
MSDKSLKWLSAAATAFLLAVLVLLWTMMNRFEPATFQLADRATVDEFLQETWEPQVALEKMTPTVKIPTGVYIQSLQFESASDVYLTGIVWQHYFDGVNDAQKPPEGVAGFTLPEQVHSGNDIEPRELYRVRQGDDEVIGWYFEATVRQDFDYAKYPFDHKTVWLRLWPRDFVGNTVLVPDLGAYKGTGPSDIFGIDETIVLGTWRRMNTYFDYQVTGSDTTFGVDGWVGMTNYPELRYNFLIRRNFQDAFVVHLLPLLMVLMLLYAALLTITDDPDLSERLGFNASAVIGSCSALFFVVLLAHMQLREQFAGWAVVYIEYFYFLLYFLLVLGAAYSYMFAARKSDFMNMLYSRGNLAMKIGYWPFVLALMILITLGVMVANPSA